MSTSRVLTVFYTSFWALLFYPVQGSAQADKADSLVKLLNVEVDTTRIEILDELSFYYLGLDDDKARSFATTALKESEKIGFKKGILRANYRLGQVAINRFEFESAMKHLLVALSIAESQNLYFDQAKCLLEMGLLQLKTDQLMSALQTFEEAIHFCEEFGYVDLKRVALNSYGVALDEQGHYTESIACFKQVLKDLASESDSLSLANAYLNISSPFLYSGQVDSAMHYLNKAEAIFTALHDSAGIVASLLTKGAIFEEQLLYNEAIAIYQQGEEIVQNQNDLENATLFAISKTYCYAMLGELDKFDAAFNTMLFLNDSLNERKANERIQEFEVRYEVAKKDRENALITLENEQKQQTINILIGTVAGLLILATSLVFSYRQRQQLARLEVQQKESQMEQLIQNQEIAAINAELEGQETERKRIAQDLHDNIGGLLATVHLQLNQLNEADKSISDIQKTLDLSIEELRNVSHNLAKSSIGEMGLIPFIKRMSESVNQSGQLRIQYFADHYQDTLNADQQKEVVRIFLELLKNTLKHAAAKNLVVQFTSVAEFTRIQFEDDGKGFDEARVAKGLGIAGIRERVKRMGAELRLDSTLQRGTSFTIEIPVT